MSHPNAFAAFITTLVAAVALYVAHRLGYAHVTSEQATVAAGAIVTAVLFLGKRFFAVGLKGVLGVFWHGSQKPPAPPAA